MARGKHDEAFQRETEKATKLGLENADHIKKARNWCKHFRIEMVSAGLLAQMSGLPIGSHRISCQFASDTHESMNLPWIVPEFILKNCNGCPYHEANGDITWGKELIEKSERQALAYKENERIRKEQLSVLREQLRDSSHQAIKSTKPNEQQILSFIEKLFSEDENEQRENSKRLAKAARIGADLFPPIAIDILSEQALSIEFASQCLPICIELAKARQDLTNKLMSVGFQSIRRKRFPELAANILVNIEKSLDFPLPPDIIENLIEFQSHSHFMGSISGEFHEYPYSNQLLSKSYDANPDSVSEPLKKLLNVDEKYQRINVCGVIEELQEKRPQLGFDLLSNLVSAFELPDEPYEESADGRIRQCIVRIFHFSPKYVDEYLATQISIRRVAVQQEIVAVYGSVIRTPYIQDEENKSPEAVSAIESAISRCLSIIKQTSIELDVRLVAAEAIEEACTDSPELSAKHFDNLLGYYSLICDEDAPNPLPKIAIPNQSQPEPLLENLEAYNYKQSWDRFKNEILNSIKILANRIPQIIGLDVIKYYDSLDSKTNLTLKASIVDLLGEVGQSYSFQPQVLPYIMKSLMDFDSPVIRAHGIRAVEKIYKGSMGIPPKNIIEVLVLHLRDTFVIVHKAAIKALSRKFWWLDRSQTIESIDIISGWMETYKHKPHDLEDLCDAVLSMASPYSKIKQYTALLVCHFFPTNVHTADQRILEHLIRSVKPNDSIAEIIAKQLVWFLKNYERDRYNNYGYSSRGRFFKWLHQLPQSTYLEMKDVIKNAAIELAKRDAWESCLFASLFSRYNDFDDEREIIEVAADSLSGEKQYEKFKHQLRSIQLIANSNLEKVRGNLSKVSQIASQVIGQTNEF